MIKVNHFDEQQRIISGEFFSTVILKIGSPDKDGRLLNITEGQFDMKF